MKFNGVDSIVDCGDIELGGVAGLSVSAWFDLASIPTVQRRIVSKDKVGVLGCFILLFNWVDTSITFQVYNGSGWKRATASASGLNDGALHHVCGVMNASGNIGIYLDGVAGSSESFSGSVDDSENEEVVIGGDSNVAAPNDVWADHIEDVRLYLKTLTVAEVRTIYRGRGRDGLVDKLLSRWTMMEHHAGSVASGAGSVVDLQGTHHGTPSGGPVYGESRLTYRRPA